MAQPQQIPQLDLSGTTSPNPKAPISSSGTNSSFFQQQSTRNLQHPSSHQHHQRHQRHQR